MANNWGNVSFVVAFTINEFVKIELKATAKTPPTKAGIAAWRILGSSLSPFSVPEPVGWVSDPPNKSLKFGAEISC